MPKINIIIFSTAYHPFVGGAEIAIEEIATRLSNRFDITIVTARMRKDLARLEERREATIVRVGLGRGFDKWLLPFLGMFAFRRVRRTMKGQHVMIMGIDISQGALGAALAKMFFPRTPFVFNVQYGESEEWLKRGRGGMIGAAFRFVLGRTDYVTAISTYLWQLAQKYGYGGKGVVVPNGVDLQTFHNAHTVQTTPELTTIITTSRLVHKNGVDALIEAMAEVKKVIPIVRLHIIGDGPERKNYERLIKKCGLEKEVMLFGNVSHNNVVQYLHGADLFVRPSRSEGMGNSFVEALAAGVPIVGTPVGGIMDIIKDEQTGLFARVDDPKDLAEKIIRLLRDKELSRRIVENGKKMVEERFSWDIIAEQYADIFDSLVNSKSHI